MDKKLNFLLIDDDDIFNFLSQRVLKSCGITDTITTFSNAKEALAYLAESKENSTDIILFDIRMPEMDGFEFLEKFTLLNCLNIDIYMLTSSLDERDKVRAFTYSSVKGFYSKPLNKEIAVEIYNSKLN